MQYTLIRSRRTTISLEIRNGELIVRAPLQATKRAVEATIDRNSVWIETHLQRVKARQKELAGLEKLTADELNALREQAKAVFPQRVAYYAPLLGVNAGRVTIRAQHTKWGSCSGKGNLNFNCLLLLAPPEVLDSVVVHELCHLIEMNHSPSFYEEVLRVFPDYRRCDRWLKDNGAALMARLPE